MKLATDKTIAALLAADPSIKEETAQAALAILRGKASPKKTPMTDKMLTRAEVAKMLGASKETVTRWAVSGKIRRVMGFGKCRKAKGYSFNSVMRLISGEVAR